MKSRLFFMADGDAGGGAATLDLGAMKRSMDDAFRTEKRPDPAIVRAPDPKQVLAPEVKPVLPLQQDVLPREPKGLRDALEKRNVELKEAIERLKEFDITKTERDALKAERDKLKTDYEAVLPVQERLKKLESVAALEQSPEFQSKYVHGRDALATRLQQLSEMAGVAPADIVAAASKTGKERYIALDEIVSSAPSLLRDDIVQTIRQLDALETERGQELSRAQEVMQERIRERETGDARGREDRAKIRNTAWETAASTIGKEAGLSDAEIAQASEFYKSNRDADKAASITIKGHAYDTLAKKYADAMTEIQAYQGMTPGIRAGKTGGTHQDADLENMPLSQRINELAKRAGVGR